MKDEELKCQTCGEEECDCGCEDEGIVELTSEDGKKLKFYHIGTIEYKNAYYAAFAPAEEIEGIEEDEIIIYELRGDDEETSELAPIEDQDLLDEVYEEFCKAMEGDECCDCGGECDGDCDCGCEH